jgi:parallel beta-helix repeat protein
MARNTITIHPGEEKSLAEKISALEEGGTLVFEPGLYCLDRGLELSESRKKLTLRGEGARLAGGKRLTGISPCKGPARERFRPEVRDKILEASLRGNGVNDAGIFHPRGFGKNVLPSHSELFADTEALNLSRWPKNNGYEIITGYGEEMINEWSSKVGKPEGGFFYKSARPEGWAESDDILLHGYWAWDWADSYAGIRLFDKKRGFIKTKEPCDFWSITTGQRFAFLNILEEVTEPGDYYIDRNSMTAYFIPADGRGVPGELLISTLDNPLLTLNRCGNITLEGFTIEAGRGHGLVLQDCLNITISDCHIRNMGNFGIHIPASEKVTISGCTIHDCGDGAININGGNRLTLAPANHLVDNNHIYKIGKWRRTYQCGVNAGGAGMVIKNNLFHDLPHSAIIFWGNDFKVTGNEIYSALLETGDAGAVYTGRDYTFRGNEVSGNYIHHLGATVGMGTMGIYNDDCVSGTKMENNILQETSRAAYLGGGRDFVVRNNLFVDCYPSVELDGRGASRHPMWRNMVDKLMRNRFYEIRHAIDNNELKEGPSVSAMEPPYITKYPELAQIDSFYRQGDIAPIPPGAVIEGNIFCSDRTIFVASGYTGEYLIRDNVEAVPEEFENYEISFLNFKPGFPFKGPDMFASGLDASRRKDTPPRVLTGFNLRDGKLYFRYRNFSDTPVQADMTIFPEKDGKKLDPIVLSFTARAKGEGEQELAIEYGTELEIEARSPFPGVRPCRFHGRKKKMRFV